ncbi:3-oxoadipate enol-lactonase [Saccharopolyspora gloriosae]|uniref:3-oxoadipate enol-lactonase n=1 Tax=Saccharopolyspora gloriosae TaxID=455344 RepID=UPI001FB5AB86|nr:3-oxoadipate enol-lactonase [Saccharopolyspora gloriosae]
MIPHYEFTGPEGAEVVVLSNSLGTDLGLWDAQLSALSERFRVLRYDQRGHGRTPGTPGPYALADLGGDVLELLDHLDVERAHFAGVSLGGMTGMWLAENAPDRLDRLALLCTSAELTPREAWRERAALARRDGTKSMVDGSLTRWFTPALASRADVVAKFGDALRACDDEGYASCAEAIADMDLVDGLPRITAPTLVIAGRDDPATPPPHAERIGAGVPGARVEIIPDASHLANVERAESVNRLLLHHFTRSL